MRKHGWLVLITRGECMACRQVTEDAELEIDHVILYTCLWWHSGRRVGDEASFRIDWSGFHKDQAEHSRK